MWNKTLIIIFFCIALITSCSNNREKYIRNIIGSELIINIDSMVKADNNEQYLGEMNKKLRIVVYSDSSNCNACDIRFPLWKIKYKELNLLSNDIGLIFIINTNNISDMELNANIVRVSSLRLYDTQSVFKKNNQINNHREFHVFLIDQDNKVVLVGNPLDNHSLYTLYKRAIEEYTKDEKN
jgi:hypothetical protein